LRVVILVGEDNQAMKRSEFERLTKEMENAHTEFIAFMDAFTYSVTAGRTERKPRRYMTSEDQQYASSLYKQKQELEDRWLTFMRSPEPVEDD
jgi:hypothetical protein